MSRLPEFPELDEPFAVLDGHRNAFLGLVMRFGQEQPVACYDRDRVLGNLVAQGMTADEAEEYFSINIEGSWVGETTPCFITRTLPPREHP